MTIFLPCRPLVTQLQMGKLEPAHANSHQVNPCDGPASTLTRLRVAKRLTSCRQRCQPPSPTNATRPSLATPNELAHLITRHGRGNGIDTYVRHTFARQRPVIRLGTLQDEPLSYLLIATVPSPHLPGRKDPSPFVHFLRMSSNIAGSDCGSVQDRLTSTLTPRQDLRTKPRVLHHWSIHTIASQAVLIHRLL